MSATRPKVYLANPYGFSGVTKSALTPIENALKEMGYEVWEPFKRFNAVDSPDHNEPIRIAQGNTKDIEDCDVVFAVLNGEPPDVGVLYEIGYAQALKKPTVFFRDDFRVCSDSKDVPANLMITAGFKDMEAFKKHVYKDVNKLNEEGKFLADFAKKYLSHNLIDSSKPSQIGKFSVQATQPLDTSDTSKKPAPTYSMADYR